MRLPRPRREALRAAPSRRGAALMLSLLVLFVLVAIVFQINIATSTDARVGRNDVALTTMDLAIESVLLEVTETLVMDAESGGDEGGAGLPGGASEDGGASGFPGAGGDDGAGSGGGDTDSRRDDWARPLRTEVNGIQLRVLIQDENSKVNILTMLTDDEEMAERALDRVARVLDLCREGTKADIDGSDARQMAEDMLRHLRDRQSSFLPDPVLLTDDEDAAEIGLPLSLREFVVLDSFDEEHFRDFRDEDGVRVHSIASFLTVWTSMTTLEELRQEQAEEDDEAAPEDEEPDPSPSPGSSRGGGDEDEEDGTGTDLSDPAQGNAPGAGGGGAGQGGGSDPKAGVAVNLNTAPPVVLKALMDDRDLSLRFWDQVIEWRNEEDEEALGEDEEPPLDEWGEEIIVPKIFEAVSDLDEFDEYRNLDGDLKGELNALLTTKSSVFSIYVTARKPTGAAAASSGFAMTKDEMLDEEESGQALTRTVRCTVWRRQTPDGWALVPIERWEVLDSMPFEILDYPEDDDRGWRR